MLRLNKMGRRFLGVTKILKKELMQRIGSLERQEEIIVLNDEGRTAFFAYQKEIYDFCKKEEIMWRQRDKTK